MRRHNACITYNQRVKERQNALTKENINIYIESTPSDGPVISVTLSDCSSTSFWLV